MENIVRLRQIDKLISKVEETAPVGSAWKRGVKQYALELLEGIEEAIRGGYVNDGDIEDTAKLKKHLLNGAESWSEYSYNGNSLIYDEEIWERLCPPSYIKKLENGWDPYNRSGGDWLSTQAIALSEAARLIVRRARRL